MKFMTKPRLVSIIIDKSKIATRCILYSCLTIAGNISRSIIESYHKIIHKISINNCTQLGYVYHKASGS